MVTDSIADYLTRIRNAVLANHKIVEIPASNTKKEITKILLDKGYILNYKFLDAIEANHPQGIIKIALKYHPKSKLSAISNLRRISKPGLRKYSGHAEVPRVMNGMGIAIISTSNGIMTDKEAKAQNIGGEILCYIS